MYNSIYPVNINFTKKNRYEKNAEGSSNKSEQPLLASDEFRKNQNVTQDEKKAAMYYASGKINISQVLADFKNTIIAINAPEDVSEEVNLYLSLVEKESYKKDPSREIIISNLKNASKISDVYISETLKKHSNVVENWISTLFKQDINLKANPGEINPDFLLKFPQKAQDRIEKVNEEKPKDITSLDDKTTEKIDEIKEIKIENITYEKPDVQSSFDFSSTRDENTDTQTPNLDTSTIDEAGLEQLPDDVPKVKTQGAFLPFNKTDEAARELLLKAKKTPQTNKGDIDAINMLNEALGILSNQFDVNRNIKAAIHLERGKLFDDYDYVDYALRDYFEATKANDLNLKAQAFYKSGKIYDEFSEFNPALDNYLSSVAYSGEANNLSAQARVLSDIARMYTKKFDVQNTNDYSQLALDSAITSSDDNTIAKTYSSSAQNYQYLGENEKAIENYREALKIFPRNNETYEQMAYNYEQAAIVMEKLGNHAKAGKLQSKANLYYQKAQQSKDELAQAS